MALLAHFGDGMFLGAVFALVWWPLISAPFILSGLAYGLLLWAGSNLLYRTVSGRSLTGSREGRAGVLLTLMTHPLYGVVVATIFEYAI